MALKKIEIFGFKSFADRTVIQFSEAISAIVGPNGCGKSNIVDAFLWVLGEQSATQLRGAKMLDVIFAGTDKRKALNMAEVTLTFDNSGRYFDVPYEEVAITRRLFRDGDSEYLINKQQVRLKDIRELFVHTGIGKEAFAVIGQGKVSELVHQTPLDRRVLFEEVAGIAHFLQKRKESQKKLELANANCARAHDIYEEVKTQKETLEKQAILAKKFQEDRDRLSHLERVLGAKKYQECKKKLSLNEKALQDSQKKLQSASEKEKELQDKAAHKKQAFKHWQEAKSQKNSEAIRLKSRLEQAQKELHNAKELGELAAKNLGRAEEKISELAAIREGHQKEQEELTGQLNRQKEILNTHLQEKAKKQEAFLLLQKQQEERQSLIKELSRKRMELFSRIHTLEADLKKSELAHEVTQEKLSERTRKNEELFTQKEALEIEIGAKKEEVRKEVLLVEEKKQALLRSKDALQAHEKEIELLKKEIDTKKSRLVEVSTKEKMLEKMAQEFEGYSQATKALLKESKNASSPLYQKVISLTDLVEEAVGVQDTTIVVETVTDLQTCLDMKKELSIICLELLGIKKEELAKHLERSYVAVGSLFDAKAYGGKAVLVSSQYFIDTFGVIHTGIKKEHSLFSQKREQKELKLAREGLDQELHTLQKQNEEKEVKGLQLVQARQNLDEEMRRADMRLVSSNFQLQEKEKQNRALSGLIQTQEQERASLEKVASSLTLEAEKKSHELQAQKEALLHLEEKFQSSETEEATFKGTLQEALQERQKSQELFEGERAIVQNIEHALELVRLKSEQSGTLLEQSRSHQKNSRRDQESSLKQEKALEQELSSLEVQQQELEVILKKQEGGITLEEEIVSIEQELSLLQKEREKIACAYSSEKTQEEYLRDALSTLQEYVEVVIDIEESMEAVEKECHKLRTHIERTKNVNLMAIEEHEAIAQRFSLLHEQLADLEGAKKELISIIQELEKESKTAFAEAFQAVRVAFQKHFQTLFNGGNADLLLTDSSDILSSGVEIIAEPPGKPMRAMQLLSGGEKSLVALALLFACFDTRPAPFCILDEVEAALDETNVERFGKLVLDFRERCQFLLITHNKRTMAIAETLLGVSMQEKGVSKIISIDFQKKAAVALL